MLFGLWIVVNKKRDQGVTDSRSVGLSDILLLLLIIVDVVDNKVHFVAFNRFLAQLFLELAIV